MFADNQVYDLIRSRVVKEIFSSVDTSIDIQELRFKIQRMLDFHILVYGSHYENYLRAAYISRVGEELLTYQQQDFSFDFQKACELHTKWRSILDKIKENSKERVNQNKLVNIKTRAG